VAVRWRERRDLPDVETVLAAVAVEGYPPHRPPGHERFAPAHDELAAFVALDDDVVLGHVAVHRSTAPTLMAEAASILGVAPAGLGVVARLFVHPSHRRGGAATALLEAATNFCRTIPRTPILDVWEGLPGAIALYERTGWRRLTSMRFAFGSPCTDACVHEGDGIRSHVYAWPASPSSS
jgi:[ribosomal protein S18]-alanine N-acetyltransferase